MFKKIIIAAFLLLSIVSFAQQSTASTYSQYGIGDVRFKGTVENRLMGGVAVFPDSIHINIQNPASYSNLKLISFTIGSDFNSTKLNSYKGNAKTKRAALDYMALAIPTGKKSGFGLGLIPYSSVGYKIRTVDAVGIINKFEGSGGLNKVFVGYGYKINSSLSIGADVNYNFGRIITTNIQKVPNILYGDEEVNVSEMSGFNVNIGGMFQRKINKKLDFYGSLTYSPESNLKSKNERITSSVQYTNDFTNIVDQQVVINSKNNLKLPSKFAIGAGFGQNKKWLLGTEVTLQQSSSMSNRFSDVTNATFENAIKYSVGGYYIPNYNSFSNYFKKITYRAGFRYENTGLVIKNESIKDYAFTGGFGLPLSGTFSNLNMGVEYGRRGTAKANLVQENYTTIIISLSFNDKWFVKRKFD